MSTQPTFQSLTQDYTKAMQKDYSHAQKLFKEQNRTDSVNLDVCKYSFYSEPVATPEDFNSIQKAHEEIQHLLQEYQGLMETYQINPDVNGYSDGDGGIEVEYVDLNCELQYYTPLTQENFTDIITPGTYSFNRLFKNFIDEQLFKDSKRIKYKSSADCKMIELFKDKIIDYKTLLSATYTECKI